MSRGGLPRLLAGTRYAALIGGTIFVALILSHAIFPPKAWAIALGWTIWFQLGLRGQALLGYAKGRAAKELSWSWALVTSFAVAFVLIVAFRAQQWRFIMFVLAWQAGAFYCIGKLTCALAGCCNADPRAHIVRPPLAIWEVVATAAALGASLSLAVAASYGAALELLAITHAAIRFGSRFGRTLVLRRAFAVDTVGLVLVALTAGSLPW